MAGRSASRSRSSRPRRRPPSRTRSSGSPAAPATTRSPRSRWAIAGGLNRNRDVIFMSQRGTYTARPKLTCPVVDRWAEKTLNMPYDAPATGRAYVAATKKCRAQLLKKGVDLGAYNTLESSNDLEELRQALGVKEWNVYGISYGTDLALNYMRMHPQGIRSVGIDGVFPPPLAGGGRLLDQRRGGNQRGLQGLLRRRQVPPPLRRHRRHLAQARPQVRGRAAHRAGAGPGREGQGRGEDQRRHAAAVDGLAGHPPGGQSARRRRRARPRQPGARSPRPGRPRS